MPICLDMFSFLFYFGAALVFTASLQMYFARENVKNYKCLHLFLLCTFNSPLHLSQLSCALFEIWLYNAIFIQLVKGCSPTDGSFLCSCSPLDLIISLLTFTPSLYENLVCISHFHVLHICSSSSFELITIIFITTKSYIHL